MEKCPNQMKNYKLFLKKLWSEQISLEQYKKASPGANQFAERRPSQNQLGGGVGENLHAQEF